jgi:hypothetical protein
MRLPLENPMAIPDSALKMSDGALENAIETEGWTSI